jgi:hypothetical protein
MSYREQRSHAKSNRRSLASINRPSPMRGGSYDEVVAHHPIGIPVGVEMDAVRPFLSKRLFAVIEDNRRVATERH